jgi:hypothetical protein
VVETQQHDAWSVAGRVRPHCRPCMHPRRDMAICAICMAAMHVRAAAISLSLETHKVH